VGRRAKKLSGAGHTKKLVYSRNKLELGLRHQCWPLPVRPEILSRYPRRVTGVKLFLNRLVLVACVCAIGIAVMASSASAQTASQQGYDESALLGQVGGPDAGQEAGTEPVSASSPSSSNGSLPFTGLDLAILALMGGVLVMTGVALRRAGRPASS
jgi:hypothetical protein